MKLFMMISMSLFIGLVSFPKAFAGNLGQDPNVAKQCPKLAAEVANRELGGKALSLAKAKEKKANETADDKIQ